MTSWRICSVFFLLDSEGKCQMNTFPRIFVQTTAHLETWKLQLSKVRGRWGGFISSQSLFCQMLCLHFLNITGNLFYWQNDGNKKMKIHIIVKWKSTCSQCLLTRWRHWDVKRWCCRCQLVLRHTHLLRLFQWSDRPSRLSSSRADEQREICSSIGFHFEMPLWAASDLTQT